MLEYFEIILKIMDAKIRRFKFKLMHQIACTYKYVEYKLTVCVPSVQMMFSH